MFLNAPLPFIKTFVDELDAGLRAHEHGEGLSSTQRKWLGFCLMGILLTNSVCWARFERVSLGLTFPAKSARFFELISTPRLTFVM